MTVARFTPVGDVRVDAALTATEFARRERLVRTEDHAAYTAAHLLVRACAGELLGVAPTTLSLEQHCPSCGGVDHGRPSLAGHEDVYVSLSHTRGYVAAIASHAPCGIDVELRAATIPSRALTGRESGWVQAQPDPPDAFTRLWVRKEALIKLGAPGPGRPGEIDVLTAPQGVRLTAWSSQGAHGCAAVKTGGTPAGDWPRHDLEGSAAWNGPRRPPATRSSCTR